MREVRCFGRWLGNAMSFAALVLLFFALSVTLPNKALAFDLSAYVASDTTQNACVKAQEVSGEEYLFLPASANTQSLVLSTDNGGLRVWSYTSGAYESVPIGSSVDLTALGMADSSGALNGRMLWVKAGGEEESITLMQSANIRSAFVWTQHDLSYIHASVDHSVSDTGTLTVLAPDAAEPVYDGEIDSIRGRGNTTWTGSDKKPYQVKLPKKQDLLGTGEKTKTWLLIANAADPTLLRNTLALKLANYLGSVGTPSCEPCDLYYNGEYRGSYLLTEKVKVEKNGVDIDDLDDENEEVNEDSDAIEHPWDHRAWSTNARGNRFSCVDGLHDPADTTGGYLVELDDKATEDDEISTFYTRTHYFTLHTPEIATPEESEYVSDLMGSGFDAAMNGGTDPTTGKTVGELFDMDTLLATGLSEEFFAETDYLYSSTYYYVPRGTGRIYVGPVWDCDRSFSPANENAPTRFDVEFLSGNRSLFAAMAARYYDTLAPTVRNVLLGDENAQVSDGKLRSIAYYRNQIAASQAMDEAVWGIAPMEDEWVAYYRVAGKKWSGYVDDLASYSTGRLAYLDSFFAQNSWSYITWRGNGVSTWVPYANGTALTDGWVRDGLDYYYMRAGRLQTGWLWDNGTWYYLNPATGEMQRGWVNVAGSWYYLAQSGAMCTGWLNLGGTWYYLADSGVMRQGWLNLGGAWYWLDWGSGAMAANGWRYVNGSWYYFAGSGTMLTGWYNDGITWYYLDPSGAMATGWRFVNGGWYYLDASGAMVTGWLNLGGTWYYLSDSGAMLTGWQQISGSWYYFDASGAMAASTWVGNYYVGASGAMATSQWVGSYYVGPDGAWVPATLVAATTSTSAAAEETVPAGVRS